ncbi:MAG: NUDIX hydrolase [bacterium]|nr:MAG: NUDIX hydrolase [bacterium]
MSQDYQKPSVTVDILLLAAVNNTLTGLFIQRKNPPFQGKWAIPGGFVDINESLENGAFRELFEETHAKDISLEQIYTFGDPKRDPRSRVITVLYSAVLSADELSIKADSDAAYTEWLPVNNLSNLAFDHRAILDFTLNRLKGKIASSPILFQALPAQFSMDELQWIVRIILGDHDQVDQVIRSLLDLRVIQSTKDQNLYSFNESKLHWLSERVFCLS